MRELDQKTVKQTQGTLIFVSHFWLSIKFKTSPHYLYLETGDNWGLKREEAVKLLSELRATFDSVESTVSVLLKNERGRWDLQIQWTPSPEEKLELQKLASKNGLTVTFENGQTKLSKPQ